MFALRRSHQPGLRRFATSASRATEEYANFKGVTYPFRWLRDSCQCPKCVHPSTRQKLHQTTDVYQDKPSANSLRVLDDGVHVSWGPDHESFYPSEFLERYSSNEKWRAFHRDVDPVPWDKSRIESTSNLYVEYDTLKTPAGLLAALDQLTRHGLVFVTRISTEKTSAEECEAAHLAEYFSEIRETFYGRVWDVINVRNSKNIAYTNLHLGLHMDLLCVHFTVRFLISLTVSSDISNILHGTSCSIACETE